jgi:hypothetical protein
MSLSFTICGSSLREVKCFYRTCGERSSAGGASACGKFDLLLNPQRLDRFWSPFCPFDCKQFANKSIFRAVAGFVPCAEYNSLVSRPERREAARELAKLLLKQVPEKKKFCCDYTLAWVVPALAITIVFVAPQTPLAAALWLSLLFGLSVYPSKQANRVRRP